MVDGGARWLVKDCDVYAESLAPCLERLREYAKRYQPLFGRKEQRKSALVFLEGLLSDLSRKSVEPIAYDHGLHRRALQNFVGAGNWDDGCVLDELRAHIREELGDPLGVLVVDGSAFPKSGRESVGVKRQWCGRLGKVDNCQVGVYLGYASPKGHTLIEQRLYLPEEWASDPQRRSKCYVPEGVEHMTSWEIAAAMIQVNGAELPHCWVSADDEFGRASEFRAALPKAGERYIVDVTCNTKVCPVNSRRRRSRRSGRLVLPPFSRADAWAKALPPPAWTRVHVRDGEKGPLEVLATRTKAHTKSSGRKGPTEWLLVTKTDSPRPEWRFSLCHAGDDDATLEDMVRGASQRHLIEEDFERAKGEVGMADYEVRSWVGWHHHMTLTLLALFFLVLEHRQIGGEKPCDHSAADGRSTQSAAA